MHFVVDDRSSSDGKTTKTPPEIDLRLCDDAEQLAGRDAAAELTELQAQYIAWLEAVPDNLQDGATADALRTVCDLDLTELQAIDPPRGFGRD